jgi:hypothetical protein
VLDRNGKVVGVVVAGVPGSGVNFAIPVSVVHRFVARPDVHFEPPQLGPANVHEPLRFEARVLPVIEPAAPLAVELVLKPARGKGQTISLERAGEGRYRATAVPLPAPPGPLTLRVIAQFDDALLNATLTDRAVKAGEREIKLSEVRSIRFKPEPRVLLQDGKELSGVALTGLDAVPVRLGERSVPVDLTRAAEVKIGLTAETDQVWYTLIVREGEREVFRDSDSLIVQGILPNPSVAEPGPNGIRPPALEGDKVVRKLDGPITGVAVGGAGRYLLLHLPRLRRLAVFDINTAEVVGAHPGQRGGRPLHRRPGRGGRGAAPRGHDRALEPEDV